MNHQVSFDHGQVVRISSLVCNLFNVGSHASCKCCLITLIWSPNYVCILFKLKAFTCDFNASRVFICLELSMVAIISVGTAG